MSHSIGPSDTDPATAAQTRQPDPSPPSPESPVEAEILAEDDDEDPLAFDPVPLRLRYDGWTPDKQGDFIEALAETACVEEACRRVRMSVASAYALRTRSEAQSFRLAWEAALDVGVARLSDAALSRALYGVVVPQFYKGEQIGEYRRYDERLTMWLLRHRDPTRYGKWLDRIEACQHPEGPFLILRRRLNELWDDCFGLLKRRFPIGPLYKDDRA